jgi:hypothetical protein
MLETLAVGDARQEQSPCPTDRVFRSGSPLDLTSLKLPYTAENLSEYKNKILYFETSRGCPFSCTYCLSCVQGGVRYFSLDYVFSGFELFFNQNIPLVKLIDRTFNADAKRAERIIRYIIKNSRGTRVHLEVAPHLLTGRLIELMEKPIPPIEQDGYLYTFTLEEVLVNGVVVAHPVRFIAECCEVYEVVFVNMATREAITPIP